VTLDRSRSGAVEVHPAFAEAHPAPLPDDGGPVRLEVVVDVASVEVFAAGGEVVLTDQVFPSASSTGIAVFAEDGEAHVRRLTVLV
jgi:sucrose-6-phosphate hydrolase SacC (GH32 family)